MRATIEVYEDNAGGIYAAVFGQEGLKNVLSGFEYGGMSTSEFYDTAMYGFYDADEYNSAEHNGRTLDEEYTSLESCNLIAEFYSDRVLNEDWGGLIDIMPTMSKALWVCVGISILLNSVSLFREK